MAIEVLLAPLGATAVTVIDGLTIHVGAPGDGSANQVGGGKKSVTCTYVAGGVLNAASDVDWDANAGATYTADFYGLWSGTNFIRRKPIALADRKAIAAANFHRLTAGSLVANLSDITVDEA